MKRLLFILTFVITLCLSGISTRASTVTISGPDTIHKARNTILTMSDILSLYESTSGEVAISADGYTGNGNLIGSYEVELYANNENIIGSKIITVNVIDSLPSNIKWIGNNDTLYVNSTKKITWESDIKNALLAIDQIDINSTTMMYILINEYSENYDVPGTYKYEFRLVDSSGYDTVKSINIIVLDSEVLPTPDYVSEPSKGIMSMIEELWSFIKLIMFALVLIIGYKFLKKRGIV